MSGKEAWFDFNDAPDLVEAPALDVDLLRQGLLDHIEVVLSYLFPAGRIRGGKFYVGDVDGNPGKSLVVELEGDRKGLWHDFATGEGGDLIALWARTRGLSVTHDFVHLTTEIQQWIGLAPHPMPREQRRHANVAMDDLGPHTAKWDYWSVDGRLLACVYRYDPPTGKEYRPRDVVRGVTGAPEIRPLYNLPGLLTAQTVVLTEGEKCAQALIDAGVTATTAMQGAQAPVDKTDWSPLATKDVLIWPDRDAPGWDYAEAAAQAAVNAGAASVAILLPPDDKPDGWDAADALAEGFDCTTFLAKGSRQLVASPIPLFPLLSAAVYLDDRSPIAPDLINGRILTPGGFLVFGGAPKVGKSDFLLAWLFHMAGGLTFLGMQPPRPLRICYLQAEIEYDYLRERIQQINFPASRITEVRANLFITPQLRLILNDAGMVRAIPTIRRAFGAVPPDVIVIDPIRNVFDGGAAGGENDNAAMLHFLTQRVGMLRDAINPKAAVILVHHTRKLLKKQFEDDPFQALAGAGSLRGYYSSGMLLYRPDEAVTTRQVIFELRNGPAIPTRHVDKINGEWREVRPTERIIMQEHGERMDAERRRKRDVILQILFEEAAQGNCYTANQFAEAFEGKAGLGANRTINDRLSVLATKGYVKYFRNPDEYGLPNPRRSKNGHLCVEGMVLRSTGAIDPDTGENITYDLPVLPTHFKCPQTGAQIPVEDPNVWIYHEDEE